MHHWGRGWAGWGVISLQSDVFNGEMGVCRIEAEVPDEGVLLAAQL